MTYTVSGGTLNPTHSLTHYVVLQQSAALDNGIVFSAVSAMRRGYTTAGGW